MKILVADDDPLTRRLLTTVLRRAAFPDVTIVEDGHQAWAFLNAPNPPRLLILDWMMPNLSGVDICRKVRAADRPQNTYIILLTARANRVDLLAALDAGADDYLTKPFVHDELMSRMHIGQRLLEKEDRLSAISQQWRAMLDNLPFGVALVRSTGELERANQAFFDFLGYPTMKALLNQNLEHILIPGQFDIKGLFDKIRATGAVDRVELEMRTRDGHSRDAILWGRLIPMAGGVMFEIITYPASGAFEIPSPRV